MGDPCDRDGVIVTAAVVVARVGGIGSRRRGMMDNLLGRLFSEVCDYVCLATRDCAGSERWQVGLLSNVVDYNGE